MVTASWNNLVVVALIWTASTVIGRSHALVASSVDLYPTYLVSLSSPPECNATFINDFESNLTKWVLDATTDVISSKVVSPTGFQLIQTSTNSTTNTTTTARKLYYTYPRIASRSRKYRSLLTTNKLNLGRRNTQVVETIIHDDDIEVGGEHHLSDRRLQTISWPSVGNRVTSIVAPQIKVFAQNYANGCLGDASQLNVSVSFDPSVTSVTETAAALAVSPCACDYPNSALPGNNGYSCADGTRGQCPTAGACTATKTFDKTKLLQYCTAQVVCSCNSPNNKTLNGNGYQCSDDNRTNYCPVKTICATTGIFNKTEVAKNCKPHLFQCPTGTFITDMALRAGNGLDAISSFACSDRSNVIVNIGGSRGSPVNASSSGKGFCGLQAGVFVGYAVGGLSFSICDNIGSRTKVFGWQYNSVSNFSCATGQMMVGVDAVTTENGRLGRMVLSMRPICGNGPTCTCLTPNTGTVGRNQYTCTDGSSGSCADNRACTRTNSFNFVELVQFCRATSCTCNSAGSTQYQCTDGTRAACPTNQACFGSGIMFDKTDVSQYCKQQWFYCPTGTFITDVALRAGNGLDAISSLTCSDNSNVIVNIGGSGGSAVKSSSSGKGFCGLQAGVFVGYAVGGLSFSLCDNIGSRTKVYGWQYNSVSNYSCAAGQMMVGLNATTTENGRMVFSIRPLCGNGPTCTCLTPNTGTVGRNQYTCTDGSSGSCADDRACTRTNSFNFVDLNQFCRTASCTCNSAGSTQYQCTDGTRAACATNQACFGSGMFNKTDVSLYCKQRWFYCPTGTFITNLALRAGNGLDAISSFTCSDRSNVIVNIGGSRGSPVNASSSGKGFCGLQAGVFVGYAVGGLSFSLCDNIGSRTGVYGWQYNSVSNYSCATGQMIVGLDAVTTENGRLGRMVLAILPICGNGPTCTCLAPNTGTVGRNQYTCTDGSSGSCADNQACTRTSSFNFVDLVQFCRTTTCRCFNSSQTLYQCTDGTRTVCPTNQACFGTGTFNKTEVSQYCKQRWFFCPTGTFITDVALRAGNGLDAISSFTCSDRSNVTVNIGGTGGSAVKAASSGKGFCGLQAGVFVGYAVGGLSFSICDSIGSRTKVFGWQYKSVSNYTCATGQTMVGLDAITTEKGRLGRMVLSIRPLCGKVV